MAKQNTRKQILVSSLLLFNERGEASTSINAIADAAGISPGNLHYHFGKKADIVDALLAEFAADMRRVLEPPADDEITVDDFWIFLHFLVEVTTLYRFLLRDMETLSAAYPPARRVLRRLARALVAATRLYLARLDQCGVLEVEDDQIPVLSRNIVILVLFSERFAAICADETGGEHTGLRVARSVLSILLPYARPDSAALLADLSVRYMH